MTHTFELLKFLEEGAPQLNLRGKDASNIVNAMYRKAWHQYCRARGLFEYVYSKESGFHVGEKLLKIGQKIPWGRQGDRRSSMLRNEAKGHVWQFGVSGIPAFWPFHHFKLKSRVLFAPPKARMRANRMTMPRNSIGYDGRCARAGEISNGTAALWHSLNSWRVNPLLLS